MRRSLLKMSDMPGRQSLAEFDSAMPDRGLAMKVVFRREMTPLKLFGSCPVREGMGIMFFMMVWFNARPGRMLSVFISPMEMIRVIACMFVRVSLLRMFASPWIHRGCARVKMIMSFKDFPLRFITHPMGVISISVIVFPHPTMVFCPVKKFPGFGWSYLMVSGGFNPRRSNAAVKEAMLGI